MQDYSKTIPNIASQLRHNILELPKEIRRASGIVIYGRRIKSLVFTTDLAIIKNCDADAVFAVYPFTPQQSISDAIIKASYVPVYLKEYIGIKTVRSKQKEQAYHLLKNITEIKNRVFTT